MRFLKKIMMFFSSKTVDERVFAPEEKEKVNLLREITAIKLMLGQVYVDGLANKHFDKIQDAEFKVFSQWGDDGIIQYLISRVHLSSKTFIEFGVGNYEECNTRFLLLNNNWSGLVMDCSCENIDHIKNSEMYWRYDIKAIQCFVAVENINEIISSSGYNGEVGILHIDIDGNDYWIWKAISVISPAIAIIEYNSLFGIDRAITVPYDPRFARFNKHHSGLYAGASLLALCDLAEEKGYCFIGSNSAGNNAYFVKKEYVGDLKVLRCSEGYIRSKFREHRDENGVLTFLSGENAIRSIKGMPVYNTRTQNIEDF